MAERNLRMGLIGGGRIGIVHAGSINDTKGVDLVWICVFTFVYLIGAF